MRKFAIPFVLLSLVFGDSLADEIYLKNGRKMEGTVLEYQNGFIKVKTGEGKVISGEISKIDRITFGRSSNAAPDISPDRKALIQRQMKARISQAKTQMANSSRLSAIVALYLDTENPKDSAPDQVEYKCYRGGGYSGVVRLSARQPFARLESIRPGDDGNRRIEIDPGPPYQKISLPVFLEAGTVTDLGRIVLKKVEGEGTVSVVGTVTGSDGKPMPDVTVSAGNKRTKTDSEGRYRLDGFGLENVSLKAVKPGYFGGAYGRDIQLSIRNFEKPEIKQDLVLYKPHRLKLKYVVSNKNDDSFDVAGVAQGSIELNVDSTWVRFEPLIDSNQLQVASDLEKFIRDVKLQLIHESGKLKLRHFMAPIYYKQAPPDATFESVTECGPIGSNNQRCPPLEEGGVILIRGYRDDPGKGRSPHCVKILVEELSTL